QSRSSQQLGRGWTHNFAYSAREDSSAEQGLGVDSAVDALPTLAAMYIARDILQASDSLDHFIIASLVQNWLADYLTDNVVDISAAGASTRFVKLPDGTYHPPQGKASTLTKDVDGSYLCRTKDGTTLDFDTDGKLEQWQNLAGITVDFSYSGNKLTQVSNSFNRILNLQYDGNDRISNINDGTGRTVSFSYDNEGNLIDYTDPEGNTTVYGYGEGPGLLTTIRYPANPANNFVTNEYDALGRVQTQLNPNGQIYEYFYANGTRTEEIDPAGNAFVWYFNDNWDTTKEIDRLGRVTTNEFDSHNRKAKTILPGGQVIEREFDANHNVVKTTVTPAQCSGCGSLAPVITQASYRSQDNRLE